MFCGSVLIATTLLARSAFAYTQVNFNQPIFYKNIDPLVFPGSYTKSHLHTFFGSDGVTAHTTTSSELQAGCTNGENPNDLSVYWVPTLLYKDAEGAFQPVPLSRFSAYYNLGQDPAEVPMPQNLMMLAGNAANEAAGTLDPSAGIQWFCEGQDVPVGTNGFPTSTCNTHLQTLLLFPSCVNEQTLETAYKSAGYGTPNRCPEGMKSMSQLRFSIRYNLRKVLPGGWTGEAPLKLACGNAYCSHGDFINGWTEESAITIVDTTREKRVFYPIDGELGGYKDRPTCKPADKEPQLGTSDYDESVKILGKRAWGSRNQSASSGRVSRATG